MDRRLAYLTKKAVKKLELTYLLLCRPFEGQSEPVGTCEKQMKCSFSLSIPYWARLVTATTAKPFPAIPAFAASIAAFRDKILV